MKLDFTGQTVLVTGATKGIGAAIASAFENAGASLILTGTHQEQIDDLNRRNVQQEKEHIRWLHADFSSVESYLSEKSEKIFEISSFLRSRCFPGACFIRLSF